jgi:hypothetical protein
VPPGISAVSLGSDSLVAGAQGLGCMGMSEFYGDTDEALAVETIDTAVDAGVTLFDTADTYGRGANERFLSPFVRRPTAASRSSSRPSSATSAARTGRCRLTTTPTTSDRPSRPA